MMIPSGVLELDSDLDPQDGSGDANRLLVQYATLLERFGNPRHPIVLAFFNANRNNGIFVRRALLLIRAFLVHATPSGLNNAMETNDAFNAYKLIFGSSRRRR